MLCEGPLGCVIALHTDAANTRCALIRISRYLAIVTAGGEVFDRGGS